MEKLDVFDCSSTFIASYFTDDRGCAHCNREHTLIYIHSGELEITDSGRKTILHPGDCAFMRRDNRMWLQKRVKDGRPYRSVVMKFSRDYLKEFFHTLNRKDIPADARREKRSLVKFPTNRLDVRSLFESLVPYFDAGVSPDEDILKMKMAEGMFAILKTDENLYASLFDFVEPWKSTSGYFFDSSIFFGVNSVYCIVFPVVASMYSNCLNCGTSDFIIA